MCTDSFKDLILKVHVIFCTVNTAYFDQKYVRSNYAGEGQIKLVLTWRVNGGCPGENVQRSGLTNSGTLNRNNIYI